MVPPARPAPGDEPLSPGPPSPFPSGEPTAAATASSSSSSSGSPNGGPRAHRARRLPAERVSPARRSGLAAAAAAAAAGGRADQRAARSAGHGGHGRGRPGVRRVDRGVPGRTRRAGRVSSPQRASLATNRRRQRRRRHLHFCPNFSVSQAWAPTGGGEGRKAGNRGGARRAGRVSGKRAAGPRRLDGLTSSGHGAVRRSPIGALGREPGPPPASGGGAARSGEHVLAQDAGAGGHALRGGISASDPSRVSRTRMVCRCFSSSGRDRVPWEAEMCGLLAAGGYVSAISRPESGGPGGDFVFPSL